MYTVFQHLGITDDECEGDVPERCSDSSYSSCDSVKRSGYTELGYEADTEFTSDETDRRGRDTGFSFFFGVMTINK